MNSSDQITRYLLGELSAEEQARLEEGYFTEPRVFDQVLKAESDLVDKYVRGKLSAQTRERFEQSYLTHPQRRERVKFAEALATRIDQMKFARSAAPDTTWAVSGWQRLLNLLGGQRPILGLSLALASLLVVVSGLWFFLENRRSRQELAQTQAVRADQDRRARALEEQVATERRRSQELTAEVKPEGSTQKQTPPQTASVPTPRTRTEPTAVYLLLTVGGVRSGEQGKTTTLVIPPGTSEARLQLRLKENEYTRYKVSLQAVGAGEIFARQGLKPKTTKSGATFTLIVPARQFSTGDYILTLRGVNQDGEVEDLSKSIFRVEKR